MGETVPSNSNLGDIIRDTISNIQQLSSGYVKLLSVINNSVDKIADIKFNTQSVGKLKQASDFVSAYSSALGSVIQNVLTANKDLLKDKSITDVLGYVVETTTSEFGTSTKGKFILLDGLVAFSNVLSNMSRMLEGISKSDYSKNLVKAKLNITLFIENTKDLIGYMVDQLTQLNQIDAKNLLGDEKTVEKLYKTEESIDKNKTSLQESEKTTVKTFGILDVLDKYLTIVKLVNDLKVPNPAKVLVQVKLFEISLNVILSSIKNVSDTYGTEEFMRSLSYLGNSFTNINKIVDSLGELTDSLEELSKSLILKAPLISYMFRKLYVENKYVNGVGEGGILVMLNDMLNSHDFLSLTVYDKKNIESADNVITALSKMVYNLASIGTINNLLGLLIARLVLSSLTITIDSFIKFIETVPEIPEETKTKITALSESISSVKAIVDALLNISKSMMLIALLALPAIIGTMLATLFVKQLITFVRWISFITHVIADKDYKDLSDKLNQVRAVVFSLLLVGGAIILLAVMSILAIPASIASIGMVIAVGLVLLAIRALMLIYETLDGRGAGGSKLVMSILSIAAVIGMIVVITLELVALSHVYKLIDWGGLFIGLGLFVLAMGAVIGIGVLLTLSSGLLIGFIGIAALAIGAILFTITAMIVISLELIVFSNLKLDSIFEKNEKGQPKLVSNMLTIVGALILVSNAIFAAYLGGRGIVSTAIVAVWLATNIVAIGAMLLLVEALYLVDRAASSLDETSVVESVNKILNLSKHVIDVALGGKGMYKPDDEGKQQPNPEDVGFFDKLMQVGGGILDVAKSLLVFANIATTALSVAVLWGMAAMLNKIADFNLNEDQIVPKVNQIILCANAVSQAVMSGGNAKTKEEAAQEGVLGKVGRFLSGGVKAISGVIGNVASAGILGTALLAVGEVEGLAAMLNKINEFNVNEDSITNKVNQIIKISNLVAANVSTDPNMPYSLDATKVKSYGVYVDDSVKLMKQINKLDTEKLVKYSDMWVKMTEFMQEIKNLNIEELSDAIVNKIAPAMEGISENVDTIGKSAKETPITANPATTNIGTKDVTEPETKLPPEKPRDYTDILEKIRDLLQEYLEM